jgi:hypothetical protein
VIGLPFDQFGGFHPQRFGYSSQYLYARIPPSALDASGVSEVDPRFERQLLLSQAGRLARAAHVRSYDGGPIYHATKKRRWAYIL